MNWHPLYRTEPFDTQTGRFPGMVDGLMTNQMFDPFWGPPHRFCPLVWILLSHCPCFLGYSKSCFGIPFAKNKRKALKWRIVCVCVYVKIKYSNWSPCSQMIVNGNCETNCKNIWLLCRNNNASIRFCCNLAVSCQNTQCFLMLWGFTTTPVISVKLYPQMSCISPAAWASPMVLSNVSIASLVSCKWQVGWTSPVGGKVKDEVSRPVVLARSSPWPSCELVPHQTEASWDLRFHKNPWWPMVIHGDPWQYPLKSASQTKTCVDTSCVLNYWAANALHRLSPILSAISRAWSTASIAFCELADPS